MQALQWIWRVRVRVMKHQVERKRCTWECVWFEAVPPALLTGDWVRGRRLLWQYPALLDPARDQNAMADGCAREGRIERSRVERVILMQQHEVGDHTRRRCERHRRGPFVETPDGQPGVDRHGFL